MSILLLPKDNEVTRILPVQENLSPITLTGSWQDLPANHLIKVNGRESLGLWLDASSGSQAYFRILCSFHGGADFFVMPNQYVTIGDATTVAPQYYFIDAATETKFVLSFVMSDVIHYCKIQVYGTGQINNAYITATGNFK